MIEHEKSVVTLLQRIEEERYGPLAMAEVGVCHGTTSADLLRRFPQLTMWLVDDYQAYMRFSFERQLQHLQTALKATEAYRKRRKFLIMHSVEAAKLVPDHSLDLVFIDGDHAYEPVRADLAAWWPKLETRYSVICGHDYCDEYPGVKKAVDEWAHDIDRTLSFLPGTVWWTIGPTGVTPDGHR